MKRHALGLLAAMTMASSVKAMVEGGGDRDFIRAAFNPSGGGYSRTHFGGMSVPRPKNQRQNRRDAARVRGHRK